jgi:GMP synthase (glutamine-hydrolysing)
LFPHLRDEQRLIEAALAGGVPVLGVCLGSQLLAATLGARVYPGKAKEIGWLSIDLRDDATSDSLFASAPRTFGALHWHGDVFDLPRGAVSLARSTLTEHQAFRHGDAAHGLLFHLEADVEHVRNMVTTFADDLADERIDGAAIVQAAREANRETDAIAESVFGGFARSITRP